MSAEIPVGTVLREGSPEPPDGTPLIIRAAGGPKLVRYTALPGSRWDVWVSATGPFVVAPDYDKLVNGG